MTVFELLSEIYNDNDNFDELPEEIKVNDNKIFVRRAELIIILKMIQLIY